MSHRYEIYSIGNMSIISVISGYGGRWQWLIMIIWNIQKYESLCCVSETYSVAGQLYFKKQTHKDCGGQRGTG